jgi:hypothetical protein
MADDGEPLLSAPGRSRPGLDSGDMHGSTAAIEERPALAHFHSRSLARASIDCQPSYKSFRVVRSKANQFPPFVADWS